MEITDVLTKEVTIYQILGVIVAAAIGWKVTKTSVGFVSGLFNKLTTHVPFAALAAAALFITGVGLSGSGIGELASRPDDPADVALEAAKIKAQPKGLTNDQLKSIAEEANSPETAKEILRYAVIRDSGVDHGNITRVNDETLLNLVRYSTPENKDSIIAMIELLKARETNKPTVATPEVDESPKLQVDLVGYRGPTEVSTSITAAKTDESMMTGPQAWTASITGIAIALVGLIVFAKKFG